MFKEKKMNKCRYTNIILFVSSLLITSILFIIATTPIADGYEISIYRVFPWYFWLLVIISYLWGLLVSFKQLFNEENTDKFSIGIPIFTMVLTTSILMLIPLIRGYVTYGRGDVMDHIGFIKDILYTGNFGDNWYPVLHILGASFSVIVNVNPKIIPMLFPPIFLLIYLIGVYYLSVELFDKKIGMIALIISLIPFLGRDFTFFAPSKFAFLFLPYFLYMILRGMRERRYLYLSSLTIFFFIISHPHRTLFFITILILIILSIYIFNLDDLTKRYNLKYGVNLTILSSIIWTMWYMLYYKAERTVNVLRLFVIGYLTGAQEEYSEITVEYSPPLIYYLRVGIHRFGIIGILGLLSLIFIFIYGFSNFRNILNKLIRSSSNTENYIKYYQSPTIILISLFMFFAILTIVFFLIGSPGGYHRLLVYVIFFSTFLVAILYFVLTNGNSSVLKRYKIKEFVYLCLVIMVILSVFNFYNSPWQVNQNSQVTEMEFSGMEWTFENRNDSFLMKDIVGTSIHRFYNAIYRRGEERENIERGDSQVDPHFGYVENDTLGAQYENEVYFILTKLSRIRHQELYPEWEEAQLYTEEDFKKLDSDKTVNNIYDNGEVNVYYIHSFNR